MDDCVDIRYNEANVASFPDAYFINRCSQSISIEFHLRNKSGCSGTAEVAGGTRDKGIGGFCGKNEIAEGGGFAFAICPQGFIAKASNGDFWGPRHKLESYYCEKLN